MQLCRQFLYSLFECRFTAPGTQCAFGSASRKLSPCSLGCRQLKIMGILAKVFTPNVDFSWSHTPRHSALKDVLSPYPQVCSTATVKTKRARHCQNRDSTIGDSRNFQFVLSLCPLSRLKYYSEKENRQSVNKRFRDGNI